MIKLTITAFAAAVAFAGVAFAADPPASTGGGDHSGWREACGADIKQYCGTATTREERHACVQANKDKFSDGCKAFMAAHPRPQNSSAPPPAGGQ